MIGDYTKQGLLNKLKKRKWRPLYCIVSIIMYFVTWVCINEYEHMSIKLVLNIGRMSIDATFQINYSDASEKEKVWHSLP